MTAGLAVANANSELTTLAGLFLWVQLHVGDPGAAGTANVSSTTTRQSVTWNAAASGSMTASNVPNWGAWAGTSPETETHVSFWSLAAGGVFEGSLQLANPVTVQTGFPLTMASLTVTLGPVAA